MVAITRAGVLHNEQLTAAVVDEVVAILSLQPLESSVHNVIKAGDGLSIPVKYASTTAYVHCMPWSRGWSIYVDETPRAGSYCWRDVPPRLRSLQRPLYTPRNVVGPWHVSASRIADALLDLTDKLERQAKRGVKRPDGTRVYMVWPR